MMKNIKFLLTTLCFAVLFVAISMTMSCSELSPGRSLHKYEWFKNQYNAIEQLHTQIENATEQVEQYRQLYGEPSTWSFSVHEEYARLQSVRSGYISKHNKLVAEYNAESSKFNWEIFKTNDLPEKIDTY